MTNLFWLFGWRLAVFAQRRAEENACHILCTINLLLPPEMLSSNLVRVNSKWYQ